MRPSPTPFQDLIESLADGTPVDWAGLEAAAHDDRERRRFRNLRLVARVADIHRTQTLDEDVGDVSESTAEVAEPLHAWGSLEVCERLASGAFGDLYRAR